MNNDALMPQILSLSNSVRKEASELEKLPAGALAAFLGGAIVIGVVGGGLWWLPAAMSGSMFAYRAIGTAVHYPRYKESQRILDVTARLEALEKIEQAQLPNEIKHCLLEDLLQKPLPASVETQVIEVINED